MVLCTQITVSQRVEAWRSMGGEFDEIVDQLRLDIALGIRAPAGVSSADLRAVNLDYLNLDNCPLHRYEEERGCC